VPLVCTPLPPNIIQDGSFEAGTPNPYWQEYSSNFGTPLCDLTFCSTGGGTGPRTGAWWLFFGGIDALETAYMRQTVTFPSGVAVLKFWLEIPAVGNDPNDFMSVMIDSTTIITYTGADAPSFPVYTEAVHDLSQFANGASHQVRFESTTYGNGITNFMVDDVELCAGAPTSVELARFEADGATAAPSLAWLLVLALPAVVGGLILRRHMR
jgi:hypothetical protein